MSHTETIDVDVKKVSNQHKQISRGHSLLAGILYIANQKSPQLSVNCQIYSVCIQVDHTKLVLAGKIPRTILVDLSQFV